MVVVKNNFRALSEDPGNWDQMMVNGSTWKNVIYESCKVFEVRRIAHDCQKQALQRQDSFTVSDILQYDLNTTDWI